MKRKDLLIKSCLVLIITFLLVFSNIIYSTMMTDTVMYWKSTSETTTIAWNAPEVNEEETNVPEGYKVVLLWVQGSEILQTYDMGITTETQITLEAPRVGCFVAGVTAYNAAGDGETAYSSDSSYATVNGEPRSWMLTYYMEKPGPIVIGKITKEIKKWLK